MIWTGVPLEFGEASDRAAPADFRITVANGDQGSLSFLVLDRHTTPLTSHSADAESVAPTKFADEHLGTVSSRTPSFIP